MEQQSFTKPKKKFYQKWWFWVIVAVVVIGAIGGANNGGEEEVVAKATPTVEPTAEPTEEPLKTFNVTPEMFVTATNLALAEIDIDEMEIGETEGDATEYKVTGTTSFVIYTDGDYIYDVGIIGNFNELEKQFYLLGVTIGIVDPEYTAKDLNRILSDLGFDTDSPDFEDGFSFVNGNTYKYRLTDDNKHLFFVSSRP